MFSLDGKIAFITGASQGIGEVIAKKLAKQGATVVVGSLPFTEEDLKRAKEHLNAAIAEVAEFNDWNAALEESVPQP